MPLIIVKQKRTLNIQQKVTTMKRLIITLLLVGGVTLAQSQSAKVNVDSLQRKYTAMSRSTDAKVQAELKKELYNQLKSKEEQRWLMAANLFFQIKMNSTSDSVQTVIKKKFPNGILIRNAEVSKIYDQKDPQKKEILFNAWIKKFSPERLGSDIVYDYARQAVGWAWAEAGNSQKALEYAELLENPVWRGEGMAGIAATLKQKGDIANAGILLQKAISHVENFLKGKDENDRSVGFARAGFSSYCNSYADILYQQKRYDEAWTYLNKSPKPRQDQTYINILIALGRNLEAFRCLDALVSKGQGGTEATAQLKALYVKLNGSDVGYSQYMSSMNEAVEKERHETLVKSMINEPAPMFSLKDVDGNVVSLADYKGKVVILDFWATWCGPCKKSFPAMQMAVNKYKDDPNVKFLFIHTWEKEDNPTKSAIDYLKENNYSFKLLMDLKDPVTKTNKVIESFKVTGIPTKFVIDGKGNIRFKVTGFSGENEAAVAEISKMVKMAGKQ